MKYLIIPLLLMFTKANAQDQIDQSGLYLGVNFGSQNVFGGSFVNDMDILAQESKFVSEISAGYRWQFLNNRIIAGLEGHIGFTDGTLRHENPSEPLTIDYKNNFQSGKGIIVGINLGANRDWIIYGYLNETKRKFDVAISQDPWNFTQIDKQGMLRYGIGIERTIYKQFNLRASFGALTVDFGDLETNIDVEDKFDFTIGFIYRIPKNK